MGLPKLIAFIARFVLPATFAFVANTAMATEMNQSVPLEVKRALAVGDMNTALPWLEAAAGAGNANAALTLGKLFNRGDGVPRDLARSQVLFEQAATRGQVESQFLLASLLERQGETAAARRWYESAAEHGNRHAQKRLRRLQKSAGRAETRDLVALIAKAAAPPSSITTITPDELNRTDPGGRAALAIASIEARPSWVVVLLAAGAATDSRDKQGNTAVHYAALLKDPVILTKLIAAGASVSVANHRKLTPLHLAVGKQNLGAVEMLLRNGASTQAKDDKGWTPRMIAERQESTKLLALLGGAAQAPRPQRVTAFEDPGQLLFAGVRSGNLKVVKRALTAGADIDKPDSQGSTAILIAVQFGKTKLAQYLVAGGAKLDVANAKGATPLLVASAQASEKMVELFTKAGADVTHNDETGRAALHHAVVANCAACVRQLLTVAGVRATLDALDNTHTSALIYAARRDRTAIASQLLAAGSARDVRDRDGRTALWWAAKKQDAGFVRLLLNAGAKISGDSEGVTPLHTAVRADNQNLMKVLLGVSPPELLNGASRTGNTALIMAAHHGAAKALRVMVDAGADLELANNVGDTALMIAVKQRALACARVLIMRGASLNRRNDQAQSARMLIEGLGESAWTHLLDEAPSELENLFNRFTSR